MLADLKTLGAAATADEAGARDALQHVADGAKGTEIGVSDLWHFKMCGSGAGQSFHEQWQGALDDPTTLRIRQSEELSRTRFTAHLRAAIAALHAENPAGVWAANLSGFEVLDLPALTSSTSARGIHDANVACRAKLGRIRLEMMRAWAVEAGGLVGVKAGAVPALPAQITLQDTYQGTLDGLMGGWETKGWAVRKSTKQRLADRRVRIAALRAKVAAAAQVAI